METKMDDVKIKKRLERERRIRESLAALHAPQPIELSAADWAEIMAETEDED